VTKLIVAAAEKEAAKSGLAMFITVIEGGRNLVLGLPGVTPAPGGFPLMADGKVIGAIGVSGAMPQQDAQVAQAGVAALEALLQSGK